MVLMAICGAAVVLGLVVVWRRGGTDVEVPAGDRLLRYLWHLNVAVSAGLVSGLLIAGSGGRLVMRLLAVTAGDGAQGRITEADEVVGRISMGGTLGFIIFVGLLGGLASGIAYALLRRWLPPGRLGGLAFGALLLVIFAPSIDPLREDNPDFDLVGPGWLALLTFSALVLAHGMAVAAFTARYRSTLPLLAPNVRTGARYLPLLMLLPVVPLAGLAVVGAVVNAAAGRSAALVERLRSRAATIGGRVLLGAGALVALPGFVTAVADIAGRGP
jgi:hypothetical protein